MAPGSVRRAAYYSLRTKLERTQSVRNRVIRPRHHTSSIWSPIILYEIQPYATTSKPSSQGLNPMRIAEILISTHACGTTMRRTNKARCDSKADVAAVSCIRPSSGASFSCEFPPETRIRIRLSIRVRIPELLQARTYAIPYVKEPAGQRDVYGQSGCCPVRFRSRCMFGIAHAARFQHE